MNQLTDAMRDMIAGHLPIVATVDPDGTPNLGPKRSLRPLDDSTLVFSESTQGQTLRNVQNGSKVAVSVVDPGAPDGYRFVGTSEVVESGPAWEAVAEGYRAAEKTPPRFVVIVHLESIHSLKPGPGAGKPV